MMLKHRFGQKVIICGVPGSIGNDLVAAADGADPIDAQRPDPVDPAVVRKAMFDMIKTGPSPLAFWSINIIDQWAQRPGRNIPGTAKEKRDAVHSLLDDGVLAKREFDLTTVGKQGKANETYIVETKAKEFGLLE